MTDTVETLLDHGGDVMAPLIVGPAPASLTRSERTATRISSVIGLVLGVAVGVAAHGAAPRDSMVYTTFDPSQPNALIPYAICCLFFWGLALCYFRWRRIRALEAVSRPALLTQIISLLRQPGEFPRLADFLDHQDTGDSPLLNRVRLVIEQWRIAPGLQEAEVVLANQVALAAETTSRRYSSLRVLVWSLPVLGLIGTVLGIANAVGGFAHFLGQDISDVGQIRNRLVGVTGGLSFAFLITLIGLLTSLIMMFISSALQTNEERILAAIHQSLVERFLPALQQAVPPELPLALGSEGGMVETYERFLRELVNVREAAITRISAVTGEAVSSIEKIANLIETGIGKAESDAAIAMTEVAGKVLTSVEHAAISATTAIGSGGTTVIHEIQAVAVTSAGEVKRELTAQASRLEEIAHEVSRSLEEAYIRLGSLVDKQVGAFNPMISALDRLGVSLEGAAGLGAGLERLGEANFVTVFGALRETLDRLAPVLEQLQRPFTLQVVSSSR